MIRKYHNHKLQTKPWHREEEPHNNHETPGRQTSLHIIGHLNGVSLADDDPLSVVVFGSTLPLKCCQSCIGPPLTKLSGSAHAVFMEKTSSSDVTPYHWLAHLHLLHGTFPANLGEWQIQC